MLQKLHGNLIFSVENLGIWGALQVSGNDIPFSFFQLSFIIPFLYLSPITLRHIISLF